MVKIDESFTIQPKAGGILGEVEILSDKPYSGLVTAGVDSELIRLKKKI